MQLNKYQKLVGEHVSPLENTLENRAYLRVMLSGEVEKLVDLMQNEVLLESVPNNADVKKQLGRLLFLTSLASSYYGFDLNDVAAHHMDELRSNSYMGNITPDGKPA
jgi:hypothetical protein